MNVWEWWYKNTNNYENTELKQGNIYFHWLQEPFTVAESRTGHMSNSEPYDDLGGSMLVLCKR